MPFKTFTVNGYTKHTKAYIDIFGIMITLQTRISAATEFTDEKKCFKYTNIFFFFFFFFLIIYSKGGGWGT